MLNVSRPLHRILVVAARNQGCPAPAARGEYIAMPQEFDAALAGVAAYFVNHQ